MVVRDMAVRTRLCISSPYYSPSPAFLAKGLRVFQSGKRSVICDSTIDIDCTIASLLSNATCCQSHIMVGPFRILCSFSLHSLF